MCKPVIKVVCAASRLSLLCQIAIFIGPLVRLYTSLVAKAERDSFLVLGDQWLAGAKPVGDVRLAFCWDVDNAELRTGSWRKGFLHQDDFAACETLEHGVKTDRAENIILHSVQPFPSGQNEPIRFSNIVIIEAY